MSNVPAFAPPEWSYIIIFHRVKPGDFVYRAKKGIYIHPALIRTDCEVKQKRLSILKLRRHIREIIGLNVTQQYIVSDMCPLYRWTQAWMNGDRRLFPGVEGLREYRERAEPCASS